ncbi:MAG: hypothetical protein AAB693_01645 [Patescibacteria group bacterium]
MSKILLQDMKRKSRLNATESSNIILKNNKGTFSATNRVPTEKEVEVVRESRKEINSLYNTLALSRDTDQNNIEQEILEDLKTTKNKKPRSLLWLIASISLIALFFGFSSLFSRAEITIEPKIESLILNDTFFATKNSSNTDLFFDSIAIPGEITLLVKDVEEKEVFEKAKGKIILYNNFSSNPAKFAANTKLEGSNGKIYRIKEKIKIPGIIKNIPGSIEVEIYADEVGEEYNSNPIDFKILNFAGSPKYSKFYGRSSKKITGGLSGKSIILSDSQKIATLKELKSKLQEKLFKEAINKIPNNFVLFENSILLETNEEIIFEPNTLNATGILENNTATIKLKGKLYGFLFSKDKLGEKILESKIKNFNYNDNIEISNLDSLKFKFILKPENQPATFNDLKEFNFNLNGELKFFEKINTNNFISEILGIKKKNLNKVLVKYPNILSVNLKISPFWNKSLPAKFEKIKLTINYPK